MSNLANLGLLKMSIISTSSISPSLCFLWHHFQQNIETVARLESRIQERLAAGGRRPSQKLTRGKPSGQGPSSPADEWAWLNLYAAVAVKQEGEGGVRGILVMYHMSPAFGAFRRGGA